MNNEVQVSPEFKEKLTVFLKALEELQKEHKIGIRPIITQFGPDLQAVDLSKAEETKTETEEIKSE